MSSIYVRALTVTATLALVACDGGRPGPALRGLGAYCTDASECESGLCVSYECTQSCAADAECAALGARLDICNTNGVCTAPCTRERSARPDDTVCLGGRDVSCRTLDPSYCDVCDGMCPGQRCVATVGCAPLADVGEACERDSDCRTDNCSAIAGVCRVPLEAACDETNCDLCVTYGSWSYCSRECGADIGVQCAGDDWDRCLGDTRSNEFWCRPSCGSGCPGQCDYSTEGDPYCRERLGAAWSTSVPQRTELQPCRYDAQCSEGTCLRAPSCDSRDFECNGRRGFCSAACASDADCGAEGRCVSVPCVGDATTGCGDVCLPACGAALDECNPLGEADCRRLPAAAGGEAWVCDPRNDDGERCAIGAHCVSGHCGSNGRCTAAGGASNGTSCGAPGDCASGNCQSGTCRGTSLRGDPCTTPFDCSVGTCVSGVCD